MSSAKPAPHHDLAYDFQAADFQTALAARVALVDDQLKQLIQPEGLPEDRLAEAMRYAVTAGGKRIRPVLCLSAGRLLGVPDMQALRAGAAVELLHAYSLAHDDLPAMDDSDLRRGQATVHKRFDEATAILAGDALQSLAFEVLADPLTHPDGAVRAQLCLALAQASGCQGMAGGQMLDLMAETWPHGSMDQDTTRRLQARKTGAIIGFSLEAAAILAGATPARHQALRAYAACLGLCFQITDDLLDARADAATLGKPTGQDARRGKSTFVEHLGLAGAEAEAQRLACAARQALSPFDNSDNPSELAFLLHMADFVLTRRH